MRKIFWLSATCCLILSLRLQAVTNWNIASGGDWFTASNWNPTVVPDGTDAEVGFPAVGGGGARPVSFSTTPTVGAITFSGGIPYSIGDALHPINFDVSALSNPSISSSGANHRIDSVLNINNPTLSITVGDASLTLSGGITGAGTKIVLAFGSSNFILSGTGSSTYDGGTQINGFASFFLTNTATLLNTGSVLINANGTFNISNSSINQSIGALSGAGAVALGSKSLSVGNGNGSSAFSGAISGTASASLTKNGSGTFTLADSSSGYGGGTNFNGGTVSINAAANLGGSGPLSFSTGTLQSTATLSLSPSQTTLTSGGGTIDVASGTTLTLNNKVTGAGSLTKTSTGTLILAGTNSDYSGGTNFNSGIVSISAAANLGGSGALSFNTGTLQSTATLSLSPSQTTLTSGGGTIDVASGTTLTLNNKLTGAGALTKTSTGTLVLSGTNNDYSGGITVSAGTLQGTTSSLIGNINNNGTVTFNQASSGTYSGNISGFGALNISGSGIVSLNGNNNTYTGTTSISAGTLSVNGQINGAGGFFTVGSSGILEGIGTIHRVVNVLGTLSPGNSPGTLTVDTVVFGSGSIFEIEIDESGISSKLAVSGTTIIQSGAQLQVIDPTPGTYTAGTSWFILSTGNFADNTQFTFTPPSYIPNLVVDYSIPNSIYLRLTQETFVGIPTTGTSSGNSLAITDYLNAGLSNPSIMAIVTALLPYSGEALNNYLNSLSPLRLASQSFASVNTQFSFSDLLSSRPLAPYSQNKTSGETDLASLMKRSFDERELLVSNEETIAPKAATPKRILDEPYRFWLSGFGQFTHEKGSDSNPSFSNTSGGALLGFDFFRNEKAVFGTSVGYAHNDLTQANDVGSASTNLYLAALYGNLFYQEFYVGTALWGGYNQISTQRTVDIPGTWSIFNSNSHAGILLPHLDFGYDFQFGFVTLEPYAAFDWSCDWESAINEQNGSIVDTNVESRSYSMLRSEVGLSLYEQVESKEGLFFARQTLSYVNKKPFSVGKITASYGGDPSTFTVETFTDCQNLISPGVELFWKEKNGTFFSILYEGEFGSGYKSNEVMGRLGVYF